MKLVLIPLLAASALFGQGVEPANDTQEQATDLNINSRYTVESVDLNNQHHYRLSTSILNEMHRLIGARLNDDAVKRLAGKIRGELRAHEVTFKLLRGGNPNSIKVLFEVETAQSNFDLSIPKFAYNSREGGTGVGQATARIGENAFSLAGLSDGDSLAERYTGIQAKYERLSLGSDRVSMGFEFDAYHEQYTGATLSALASGVDASSLGAGAYRSRLNFEPSATFVLAAPLTLTIGFSFEQLQPQLSAAPSESANALITTLRYHQRWIDSDDTNQELDAGYYLRAATRSLGSDLAYTRHAVNVRYALVHDHQTIEIALVAGLIYGRAPLFERFVLGDNTTLRGWDKYDIDPLGGNRMVHGSVTYGYRIVRVFYDTGAVWDQGTTPEARHSVGVGVSSGLGLFQKGAVLLAVAFPIRQGRAEPVFIAGMNF
ncbi:MAG TPA: BamA/TamA family outer membrane protein [Bryobacteraceae bacterium]|nr:BamA/TamA family outer membrane protein [Bryobacteraceae bacterium]